MMDNSPPQSSAVGVRNAPGAADPAGADGAARTSTEAGLAHSAGAPGPSWNGTAPVVVRAEGLSKTFAGQDAVQDLTFEVPNGAIFGLIGPSGCGKTTTIRLMMGIYEPTGGSVTVLGQRPKDFSARTRERLGYMPQQFVLYPGLSVWENMNFAASIYGMGLRRARRLKELLEFVELSEHRGKLARNLSGGMQRRLALAATLAHDPEMIVLDEPTAGIDPVLRRKLWDYFNELQGRSRTLFVTTQYVGEAAYCDLVGVMSAGRLLMVETPEGLRRRAFGGEAVDLRSTERLDYRTQRMLRELPFVQGSVTPLNETTVRLVVDEASTAMPALLDWCKAQSVTVESIEEFVPPLDDVFVELMRREAGPQNNGSSREGARHAA